MGRFRLAVTITDAYGYLKLEKDIVRRKAEEVQEGAVCNEILLITNKQQGSKKKTPV